MASSANMKKLLKDYLEELDDQTMKEFKWHLSLNGTNGSRPIPRCRLMQDVARTDIVDMMVQAYGETGAAEAMVDVLLQMNQNDLRSDLAQALAERQKSHETHEEKDKGRKKQTDVVLPHGIDEDLSCPICLTWDLFMNPMMLSCGHSFCKTCLDQMWEGKAHRRCPTCQEPQMEEAKRLAALKEEERKKSRMTDLMTELNRETSSLFDAMKNIDLGADNSLMQDKDARLDQSQHLEMLQLIIGGENAEGREIKCL